jgi:hypothetical protein
VLLPPPVRPHPPFRTQFFDQKKKTQALRDLAAVEAMAASAFLPELATQVLVPAAAVVGIAFAVVQWVLVSKVKMSPDQRRADGGSAAGKSGGAGASEYLIEEEEGLNEHNVVVKCAEIQNAISEGEGRGRVAARVLCSDLMAIIGVIIGSLRFSRRWVMIFFLVWR